MAELTQRIIWIFRNLWLYRSEPSRFRMHSGWVRKFIIFWKNFCRKKANWRQWGMKADLHRIFPMREKCLHVCSVPWRKPDIRWAAMLHLPWMRQHPSCTVRKTECIIFREKRRHMQRWMSICGVRTRREVPIHPKHMWKRRRSPKKKKSCAVHRKWFHCMKNLPRNIRWFLLRTVWMKTTGKAGRNWQSAWKNRWCW